MSEAEEATVYVAALRAAFDFSPALSLLLHPTLLPRTAGYDGGDAVPAGLRAALTERGVIRGTCQPTPSGTKRAPRCADAELPGYVVRFSDVFRRGGDTLQMHLLAERYDTPATGPSSALRFEYAYQLRPRDDGRWRVVREGRIRSASEGK